MKIMNITENPINIFAILLKRFSKRKFLIKINQLINRINKFVSLSIYRVFM